MSAIYVLHDNEDWLAPLRAACRDRQLPLRGWHLDAGSVALHEAPPQGIFFSRISASSHTRGHRHAPELGRAVLHWLEVHGRRVINGSRALALEIDKFAQYAALSRAGIRTPRTIAAVGREATLQAARELGQWPLILKPNRGGKGLGVQLIPGEEELAAYLQAPGDAAPIDGVWLVQAYLKASEPAITRMEFIGGRLHYAVRVDTSGGFELCPADGCALPDGDFCMADTQQPEKFRILPDFSHPLVERLEALLPQLGIEVAGVEFITDESGTAYVYDINTNTNYNADAEKRARATHPELRGGMQAVSEFLAGELALLAQQDAAE